MLITESLGGLGFGDTVQASLKFLSQDRETTRIDVAVCFVGFRILGFFRLFDGVIDFLFNSETKASRFLG